MASQGWDFTRFRDALDSGNVAEALTAASALPHVGLVEALELCLLLCDEEPGKFSRAGCALNVSFASLPLLTTAGRGEILGWPFH